MKTACHWIALLLGTIGIAFCLLSGVGVWIASGKLHQLNDGLFKSVDNSLMAAEERSERVASRLQELKFTTRDIEQGVKNWTKVHVGERIGSNLDLERKFDKVSEVVGQVDHYLELSESSLRLVEQALRIVNDLGEVVRVDLTARVQEEIVSTRKQLARLTELLEATSAEIKPSDKAADSQQLDRLVKITARLVASVSSLDAQVSAVDDRLRDIRKTSLEMQKQAAGWISLVSLLLMVFAVWMAVGQFSLCYVGWNALRRQLLDQ